MNVYTMVMNQGGGNPTSRDVVTAFLRERKAIGIHEDGTGYQKFRDAAERDLVLVRGAGIPVALVRIMSAPEPCGADDLEIMDWLTHIRPIKVIAWYADASGTVNFPAGGWGQQAFNEVHGSNRQAVLDWYNKAIGAQMNTQIQAILESNHQLVLTGAPGTGKTYTARRDLVESQIAGDKFRMKFVQFHPNFDYTDFVEGLRPDPPRGGQIGFSLRNGVFKEFCRRAGVIERILFFTLGSRTDKRTIHPGDLEFDVESVLPKYLGKNDPALVFWRDWIVAAKKKSPVRLPPFYFIIDEINRANLSRVFGELFYSLEPDYRGVDGAVATQYASLNTDSTFFVDAVNPENDQFFIPSNVYIVGTMNDIDRSVESFDFALRRRFAWHEIKAMPLENGKCAASGLVLFDRLMGDLKSKIGDQRFAVARRKYQALNEAIVAKGRGDLTEDHMIGPAYFRKLEHYLTDGDPFAVLWANHLELLIKEYLRGTPKAEDRTTKLRSAYMDTK